MIVSPTFGVGLLTENDRPRSAVWGWTWTCVVLSLVSGSNSTADSMSAETVAGLAETTVAWRHRVTVASLPATVPTVHSPVVGSYYFRSDRDPE